MTDSSGHDRQGKKLPFYDDAAETWFHFQDDSQKITIFLVASWDL